MKRKLKKELLLMNMEANVIITKTSSFYNSATSNKGESYILRKGTTLTLKLLFFAFFYVIFVGV